MRSRFCISRTAKLLLRANRAFHSVTSSRRQRFGNSNEANLQGQFTFSVKSREGAGSDFLERLRDQTGLVIAQAQRTAEILAFETP